MTDPVQAIKRLPFAERSAAWDKLYERDKIKSCCICGKTALYMWGKSGYCREHRGQANASASGLLREVALMGSKVYG